MIATMNQWQSREKGIAGDESEWELSSGWVAEWVRVTEQRGGYEWEES